MEGKSEHLEIAVTQLLQQSGIPANLLGYRYLRIAITFAVEQPNLSYHLAKLYETVAASCQTEPRRVERAIRNAVQSAYDRNPDMLRSIFYYPVDKPCNAELIALIADNVRVYQGFGKG